jgi:hypothetical protein
MKIRATLILWLLTTTPAGATVYSFTDESAYLSQLSSLGYNTFSENFEDTATWGGLRTLGTYHAADSVTAQGITWDAYYNTLDYVTTQQRFHALPGESNAQFLSNYWGFTVITRRNSNDAFKGASNQVLYGVGGYIDTVSGYTYDDTTATYSPEAQLTMRVGGQLFTFGGNNDIAWGTPTGNPNLAPRFFGVIDTDGFQDFAYITDVGYGVEAAGPEVGYYGPIIWGDNFTFASLPATPPPGTPVDPLPVPLPPSRYLWLLGLILLLGHALMRRRIDQHRLQVPAVSA